MIEDSELLQQYAKEENQAAFAEIVQRHLNLVYSAALRQVGGDADLAKDVSQNVFTDLARKAASLSNRPVLTGWLYTSAHFAAAKIVRTERRRAAREQEAHAMQQLLHDSAPDADWTVLSPVLDELMHQLNESDREAVLLRYFENRPFAEVGAKLGVGENAARMRVDRALEKLRALFKERSVTISILSLGAILSGKAVVAAPNGLAAVLSNTAMKLADASALNSASFLKKPAKTAVAITAVIIVTATIVLWKTSGDAPKESLAAAKQNSAATTVADGQKSFATSTAVPENARRLIEQRDASLRSPPVKVLSELTNAQLTVEAKFLVGSSDALGNLALPGGQTGMLTDAQLRVMLKQLKQSGVTILSAPRVTTLSGRQANLSTMATMPRQSAERPVSLILDVLPTMAADGMTINLIVYAGMETPRQEGSPLPPPILKEPIRWITNNVQDHQTLMLSQLIASTPTRESHDQYLITLITPTRIDAAGNVFNSDEDLANKNAAPPH